MFFSLEHTHNNRFPWQYQLGDLVLNTDAGWHQKESNSGTTVYKGYLDNSPIDSTELVPGLSGNFCAFDYNKTTGTIAVITDCTRSFPMWVAQQQSLTNLTPSEHAVWADGQATVSQDLSITEHKFNVVGTLNTGTLTRSQAVDIVHEIIDNRVKSFIANNQRRPIKVFMSGGVDSMVVASYIMRHTDNFEYVFENRVQWDEFWCKNSSTITQQFWGYTQIHHWIEPCFLSSGAPGDEFMLRSPTTANLFLMYHGTGIDQVCKQTDLHYNYFQKAKHQVIFRQQEQDSVTEELLAKPKDKFLWELCNIVVNDFQHWHLGNTLTFTPLRDIEIFKTLLRLDTDTAIKQIVNSEISFELIARNNPDLLNYLSPKKNVGNVYENLFQLMSKVSARSGQ